MEKPSSMNWKQVNIIPTDHLHSTLASSFLSSVSSLVALQLFSRLFTFGLNQVMFQLASPKAFGTAAIQFELLLGTILFISREGARNALLRVWPKPNIFQSTSETKPTATKQGLKENARSSTITNLAFLPIVLGLPLSLGASYLYAATAGAETRIQPYFNLAIILYAIAAIMELCSEPLHNRAMGEAQTGVRVRSEGVGIMGKALVTALVLWVDSRTVWSSGHLALLAFAGGQLTYGALVLTMYASHFGIGSYGVVIPLSEQHRPNLNYIMYTIYQSVDHSILRLSLTMTAQSIFKHLLTEGDKLIISLLSPLQDQGGYAIAVNYGSLIARIVFQPIEETLRVYFSNALSNVDQANNKAIEHRSAALRTVSVTITLLLTIQLSIAIVIVTFGSAYISIVVPILLPPQYLSTSAPSVLAAWVWYIPVLAINGGLEAFVSSAANPTDLVAQSRWMAAFSTIYILASIILYRLGFGDTSLVYANIANLLARIMYCLRFISSYFRSRQAGHLIHWRSMAPGAALIGSSLLSWCLVQYSANAFSITKLIRLGGRTAVLNIFVIMHVILGGMLAVSCLAVWWFTSGRYLLHSHRIKGE